MAVDASIPLQVKLPQFNTPLEAQAQAASLRDQIAQTQLRQQQVQQGFQTIKDQQEVSRLWADRSNINPETGLLDPTKVQSQISNPNVYQQVVKLNTDALYNKQKAEREKTLATSETIQTQQKAAHDLREEAIAAYQDQLDKNPNDKQLATDVFNKALREGADKLNATGIMGKNWAPPANVTPELAIKSSMTYKERLAQQEKEKSDVRAEQKQTEIERENRARDIRSERSERRLEVSLAAKNALAVPVSKEDAAKSGDEFLKTLSASEANEVRAIGEGRMTFQDLGVRGKARERMASLVSQAYPGYDSGDVRVNRAIEQDFAKGKPAQSLQSINAVTEHLGTYRKLAKALDNGDIQMYNKYKTEFERATGKTLPNDLKAAAPIIGSEIVKAIVPGGGGVEERRQAQEQWNTALSNKQIESQIDNVFVPLMQGQVTGLRQRYESSGKKDFNSRFLTPEARKSLKIGEEEKTSAAKAGGALPTATNPQTGEKLVFKDGSWQPIK